MSKAVLISIRPEWCDLIKNGIKTLELRKSRPKLELPFKVYIYCTIGCSFLIGGKHPLSGNGKIIGEFVCDEIEELKRNTVFNAPALYSQSCLTRDEYFAYIGNKIAYIWHISDLVVYDKPKELSDFNLKRPPQSWCYVEEEI